MSLARVAAIVLVAAAACAAPDASAARRGIRVDGFGDTWVEHAIGTADCPGTTSGSTAAATLVQRFGFTFSGRENTAHLFDTYCQTAEPGTLTESGYTYGDEQALALLFGDDPNAVHGVRYAFLDADRFSGDATGFQWAFYSFPGGVTAVTLYGLEDAVLDGTSYIDGLVPVWNGVTGYDGAYYCFRGAQYIGEWNGELSDTGSACLQALQLGDSIFRNGFDGAGGGVACIDIDGTTSNAGWRSGDAHNAVMQFAIGAGNALSGIAIDATVEAFSPSWLSESWIGFSSSDDSSGAGAYFTSLSTAEVSGVGQNLSVGPLNFADIGQSNVPAGADGMLRVERFESFADDSVDPDSSWTRSTSPVTCPGVRLLCTNQSACDAAVAAAARPPRT